MRTRTPPWSEEILKDIEDGLIANNVVPTLAEFIRLWELHNQLTAEGPKALIVGWRRWFEPKEPGR